ncbi:NIPSNAP family protein [Sphaerisporangium fuscum]|uniref:NIPSNAP family protein n=1 Tax=Sphaerisporangium fuscum TaxID=2835868 RepID=UPI001BDBDCFB|nr:NIPSNAP family protein [Sphaerisporangium fuscum]
MRRGIYLVEEVDFRPMNSRKPLEYLTWLTRYKKEDERLDRPELTQGLSIRSREIDLVGAFYAVGITGHPQFKAVTLWDCHGGWDGGWRQMMNIYDGVDDKLFLSDIDDLRFSAFSRPLGAAHDSPAVADLLAEGYAAPFYLFESARVRPGAALDYLAAVKEERLPILADHGHRLVGLYEVLFCDTEVVTIWGMSLDDHLATQRARDAALGLDDEVTPDPRLLDWQKRARHYLEGPWRETLLAPFPGSRLAPAAQARLR